MSSYNYKQAFWLIDAGTGDIGGQARAQIAKAALALNSHQDVVLALSSVTDAGPQMALTVAIDYDVATLLPAVESALAAEGLPVKAILQSDPHHYEFGSTELSNFSEATKVVDLDAARKALDELYTLPLKPISAEHAAVTAGTEGSAHEMQAFSVKEEVMERLRDARGSAVEKEIRSVIDALVSIRDAPLFRVVSQMISGGIITIGTVMFTLYRDYAKDGVSLPTLLTFILELQQMHPLKQAIAPIVSAFKSVLNERGVNIFLFVNGQMSPIKNVAEYCHQDAQCVARVSEIQSIFSELPDRAVFPCGFYFYHLKNDVPHSTDACRMGVEFRSLFMAHTKFSVGMACPVSTGDSSSIRVTREDARAAEALAARSETSVDSVDISSYNTCTVSRAEHASVNFGIAYLN